MQKQEQPEFSQADLKPLRLGTLVVILAAVSFYLYWNPAFVRPASVADIRRLVAGWGAWGPVVYIGLYTVRPLLLLPSLPFNLAAGILFTPLTGLVSLLLGGLGSASLVFGAARWGLGRSLLAFWGGTWGQRLDAYLADKQKGGRNLFWLRIVPIFAYDPVSIVAACTGIRYRTFALATLAGMLPGAVAYCFLGEALVVKEYLPLALVLLLVVFGVPFACWYLRKQKQDRLEKKD